jgi:dihydroflavonol-4-reductase
VLHAVKATGKRLVYTGSVVTVAPPRDDRPAHEDDGIPHQAPEGSTYFAIKLALEAEVRAAVRDGVDVVTLLPTGCFGPYDHKVGTGFFVVALAHQQLPAFVDGRINVVDVRDVAAAHVAAAEKAQRGHRYILGGHNLKVSDLVAHLARRMEVPLPSRVLPVEEALAFATAEEQRVKGTPERPGLSREMVDMAMHGLYVDSAKARAELGFNPRPLEETLGASYEWYRQNGYIRRNA